MTDYTSAAVVKARLGIDDTADDTAIGAVISGVSQWIDRYCGRSFALASASGSIRTYTAAGADLVYIDDAVEIIEITTDDGTRAYATTMAADTYEGAPYNVAAVGGPVYNKIYAINGGVFPTGRRAVKVEARYGWDAIPAPIVEACILQSMRLFKRKDAPFGVVGSPSAEMGQLSVIPKMDPDVTLLLEPYRRKYWIV